MSQRFFNRRRFLRNTTAALAAVPLMEKMARAKPAAPVFDPDFGSATQALRAIREKAVSCQELVAHTYERIRKYNGKVNAFVTLDEERAREQARRADEVHARGVTWGPLHGLPILIKDSFQTARLRTTSGSRELENYIPESDALAVGRLRAAGAIILGKTNLPQYASDLQCYNEVAGTTNNPWDLSRTPGGSTGGGAAALAAGFGFLELGSDIGGSIRTPSHFCGVYGHKPTLELLPVEGHIPPPPGQISPLHDLGVAGPLARSAQDLLLELSVIARPGPYEEATAINRQIPTPRGTRLRDYRIGYVLDDPFCPVSTEVRQPLVRVVDSLGKAGVRLVEGWPAGFNARESFELYLHLLAAAFSEAITPQEIELMERSLDSSWGEYARIWLAGSRLSHGEWRQKSSERLKTRALWQDYFRTFDAFLMPENFIPAFTHDHEGSFFERTVASSDGPRQYGDMLRWISPATLTGCPATVAPVGRTEAGLPVGIQIMGPFLEDATPIAIAGGLSDLVGGFEAPPGFRT